MTYWEASAMIRTMTPTNPEGNRRILHPILIHLTTLARVFRVHLGPTKIQVVIIQAMGLVIRGDDRIMARVITLQVKAEVTIEATTMVVDPMIKGIEAIADTTMAKVTTPPAKGEDTIREITMVVAITDEETNMAGAAETTATDEEMETADEKAPRYFRSRN